MPVLSNEEAGCWKSGSVVRPKAAQLGQNWGDVAKVKLCPGRRDTFGSFFCGAPNGRLKGAAGLTKPDMASAV